MRHGQSGVARVVGKPMTTRQSPPAPWIATVVASSRHPQFQHSKSARARDTKTIVRHILESTTGRGIVLFPAGWFLYAAGQIRQKHYRRIADRIAKLLEDGGRDIVICLGIDGELQRDIPVDQAAIAVGRDGIVASARKFHGTADEAPIIRAARDGMVGEGGYPRSLDLGGRSYWLAVCYDIFGIRHRSLPNPGCDAILSLVHGFSPRGQTGCGDVYLSRLGFAGASRAWGCPVYGAAVFFQRPVPPRWPSGVLWRGGDRQGRNWRYADNGMRPEKILRVELIDGRCEVRVFGRD